MTDAEFRALVMIPLDNAVAQLWQEVRRARAAELALTARVAALEAELAALRDGMTGTPEKAGRYWCEWPGVRNPSRREAWWEHDQGWIDSDGDAIGTPARYWPLPGEVYQ